MSNQALRVSLKGALGENLTVRSATRRISQSSSSYACASQLYRARMDPVSRLT
jgi:hypothetical protein